jgi:hypothetical protein
MSKYVKSFNDVMQKIKETTEKSENSSSSKTFDEYWKATIDSNQKEVEYRIRFLPNPGADWSWVERDAHMMKFPNGNYVYEPCPKKSKISKQCRLCKATWDWKESGAPQDKAKSSKYYAKSRFFQNILVLEDPRDNNVNVGKTFIFEYGIQVQRILDDYLTDEKSFYFCPVDGADFKLKINWSGEGDNKYPNYTLSKFLSKSPITINDKKLEEEEVDKIIEACFDLNEKLLSASCFKTSEEIWEIYVNQGYPEDKKSSKQKKTDTNDKIPEKEMEDKSEEDPPWKDEDIKNAPEPDMDSDDISSDDDDEDAVLEAMLNN